jgi:dihydroflavonol-4-reductase
MDKNNVKNVLVTGITGFIGSHVAVQLLNNGYAVRGSMRNLNRKDSILEILKTNCPNLNPDRIEFVKGELTNPEDWDKAMEGMDFVMHVASPLPFDLKKDANDLIIPAREGTLNVLKAAQKNKIKRVVLTSSIAAIGHGHKIRSRTYTEDDWTNLKGKNDVLPYTASKTIAESEAWKFVNQTEVDIEMAAINPGYVFGPLLEKDFSDSAEIIRKLMVGEVPGLPKISFPIVDVRDVAEMHVWALELPEAAGKRFICVNESNWYQEIAMTLKNEFPEFGKKIKTLVLPDFFIRLYSLFDKGVNTIKSELGCHKIYDNSRAVEMFNWTPRSNKEAIISMAESMIRLGVI